MLSSEAKLPKKSITSGGSELNCEKYLFIINTLAYVSYSLINVFWGVGVFGECCFVLLKET